MRLYRAALALSGLAVALALTASVWLAVWPGAYQGVSATEVGPGATPGEPRRFSASLIDVNGPGVLWVLALPVGLSTLGLLAATRRATSLFASRLGLWATTVLLWAFCALGAFSIGVFYLPPALALLAAAITDSLSRDRQRHSRVPVGGARAP